MEVVHAGSGRHEFALPALPTPRVSLRAGAALALVFGLASIAALVLLSFGFGSGRFRLPLAGLAGLGAAGSLGTLGQLVLSSRLRPLAELATAARNLAADLDVALPVTDRRDEIGDLARALGSWRYAIAERLAMAQMAAEDQARFRVVFDAAPIGIARIGRDLRILDCNLALLGMLGYRTEELQQLTMAEVLHVHDRAATSSYFKALDRTPSGQIKIEKRFLAKDGTSFWGCATVAAVQHPDGRVLHYVGMIQDVSERRIAEARLLHETLHDPLTGLPNRVLMHDRLAQAVTLADRHRQTLAVLLVDLDGFKEVNDTCGHDAGDELLHGVAQRFQASLRQSDTVSRLGGDEFAVILPEADAVGAEAVAIKLLTALRLPFTIGDRQVSIGASIGAAVYPEPATTQAALLKLADDAMYRAKRAGGGFAVSEADTQRRVRWVT